MTLVVAGWAAFSFGGLNLFARALGGFFSDKVNARIGLTGRVYWLFAIILAEGLAMVLFSRMYATGPMMASFHAVRPAGLHGVRGGLRHRAVHQ